MDEIWERTKSNLDEKLFSTPKVRRYYLIVSPLMGQMYKKKGQYEISTHMETIHGYMQAFTYYKYKGGLCT